MKDMRSKVTKGLTVGSTIEPCDNSGAKLVRIVGVKKIRTVKGRYPSAGIGDLVLVSVKKGKADMRKQVVPAIIVRQRRAYRRPNGMRIKFEDNAVIILKDEAGNPKGTTFKGPIAREVAVRWPAVAKQADIIV